MKCPSCGSNNAYIPLLGPVECLDIFCKYYNEEHSKAVQNYEIKQLKSSGSYKKLSPNKIGPIEEEKTSPGGWTPYRPNWNYQYNSGSSGQNSTIDFMTFDELDEKELDDFLDGIYGPNKK